MQLSKYEVNLIKMVPLGCDFFASLFLPLQVFAIQGDEQVKATFALSLFPRLSLCVNWSGPGNEANLL